ncbi:septum formation family protein [Zhihengliuella sp.]|uniref:septum formation family protein n=1 Tax=Zhihengliuella sp. TaxID=1954483 RepID=UPI0028120D6B|nr:septum formation family protein [Zhihengliuella sp.]
MEPSESPQTSPYQPPRPAETETKRPSRVWLVVGALAVVLLVVYAVFRLDGTTPEESPDAVVRNDDPGIDGIIAADAPASAFEVGDCLAGFTSPLEEATIVTCQTPHNAQFIGTATLDDLPYPGEAGTTEKAAEACKAIKLDTDVLMAHQWTYQFSQPSSGSWEAGDRDVACFLSLKSDDERTADSVLPPAS